MAEPSSVLAVKPPSPYDRALRLLERSLALLFLLCVLIAWALHWRPLGTLDFVRVRYRVESSWTAPGGAAQGFPER